MHLDRAITLVPLDRRRILRETDQLHLAELHPQEASALRNAIGKKAKVYQQDGYQLAQSLCPQPRRRGLLLIDPSYEIKMIMQRSPH